MKLRQITSPRHTYDGYFETYFIRPFFHLFANFTGHDSWKSCILSLAAWVIVTLGIAGIMMGQIGLIGPEAGITASIIVGALWIAFSLVPISALITRASNGAPAKPLSPRMLGVDTLLGVSCLLFFVFGLLMMVTTLNSEVLNPNALYRPDADTLKVEQDYVVEEPIFTYQDDAPATSIEEKDSLSDVTEPDLATPDESFDPTIEVPEAQVLSEPISDSI